MRPLRALLLLGLVAAALLAGLGRKNAEGVSAPQAFEPDLQIFKTAIDVIERHYVDPVTPTDLVRGALKGILGSLDPYSQFLDPRAHEDIKTETEGRFGGIGVEVTL
ncbi:MAG: peptidase S41, partial [Candidatus Omnitrophica bacterium]|nr:peptidase S41 [Candidatus Omnitrophota bacterium]